MDLKCINLLSCQHHFTDFTQCGIGLGPNGGNNNEAWSKIVNGNNAPERAWPWMVGIYKQISGVDVSFKCGGTLISPDWILTAAHCVDSAYVNAIGNPQNIRVVLGK